MRTCRVALLVLLLPTLVLVTAVARASTETVLYTFPADGSVGLHPYGALISDASGSLYGTTWSGGNSGAGTVFRLTPSNGSYSFTLLYSFRGGKDGAFPYSRLAIDSAGNLYGTTFQGGGGTWCTQGRGGCGVVFKLTLSGGTYTETVIHAFKGGADGYHPHAGVALDPAGNIFGATYAGGSSACGVGGNYDDFGCGTIFKLSPSGSVYTKRTVYAFKGAGDGGNPWGDLLLDSSGNLYGTTRFGGDSYACQYYGCGTVFRISPSGGSGFKKALLYSFNQNPQLGNSIAAVVLDSDGNLYGTIGYVMFGFGGVFKLTPTPKGHWSFSLLYLFQAGADGSGPAAPLVRDGNGNLYGTTVSGGICPASSAGCGTVFKLTPGNNESFSESILYAFQGGPSDGQDPEAGLFMDQAGNLYGTSVLGGPCENGCGSVFKIAP